ncbi:TonB-dependent receptor [Reichenbachiella sp. MALMAid0571]|uniref:TonB-dependent receptor n=1 Tax=Reichenbachiella sp. MALMAid0571 TaxID=3143939 RepID=UPI0032DFDE6A
MKKILLSILLFLAIHQIHAQNANGTVNGKITKENSEPLFGISVGLKGTSYGSPTDTNGRYSIANIPSGSYTLVVSGIGYQVMEKEIKISKNQNLTFDFKLNEKNEQLQEVVVLGSREGDYVNEISSLASKSSISLKDVPQAVSYVTKELIQDQKAFLITDVVKNISGINQESISGDYMIRGFAGGSNIMINGLRISKGWMPTLISNLERVEVIKGANSALYGYSDPGGTINRVTKKPMNVSRQGISFSTGSFGTIRSEADVTGPVNQEKTLLYRVNLAYQDAGSFRDLMGRKDILIAPSLSYLPSEKTRVDLDLICSNINARVDRGQPFIASTDGESPLLSTPKSLSATYANSYNKENTLSFIGSVSHDFSDRIKFNSSFITYQYERDYLEHRTNNRYGVDGNGDVLPTLMEMRLQRGESRTTNINAMSYVNFSIETGRISHRALIGYDFAQQVTPAGGWDTRLVGAFRNADNTGALNSYDPDHPELYLLDGDGSPVPNMPYFDLVNPDYTPQDINGYFTRVTPRATALYYTHGVYIQDQIRMGKVQVLLGLRQEFYNDFENYQEEDEKKVQQTSLIPRLGAVFSLTDKINLYGTYVEGFQPQSASIIGDPEIYGGPFDPLTSNMIEFGTKSEWFNKGLTLSASIYQIELNNVLINANDAINPDLLKQRGQERSKGFEVDINGKILPNLSISANYAYNEALITQSDNLDLIGTHKEYAPVQMGGTWIKYNVNKGQLNGAGIALGSNFVTKQITGADFDLPGYTVVDAALFYQIEKLRLSLNINNVTDKTYWVGRGRAGTGIAANPGAPRNFLFSVGYTF